MNRLGELLEAERAKHDLTLTEFAERVLGISHSLVSRYVNGVQSPSRRTVRRIADRLGVTPAEIDAMLAEADVPGRRQRAAERASYAKVDAPDGQQNPASSGTLPADDATPHLAEAHFFGLVSELGTLTAQERAAVLPVLREIVSRRRADRGGGDAGGGGAGGRAPA